MKNNDEGLSFYSKWYNIVLIISAFSVVIGSFFTLILNKDFSFGSVILPSLLNTAVLWGGSILIVKYSWQKFPWEEKPLKHLLFEIALIILLLLVFVVLMGLYYSTVNAMSMYDTLSKYSFDIAITILITFLIVTIHEAIYFYQQWKYHFSKSVRLEKDNLEAQYKALKAQVNPHFLFNSLNSLSSMLDSHPHAEKYVQELSEYLRYVLVSNTREMVSLKEEMEICEKYLYLQKQRFGDNFDVEMKIESDSLNKNIPSMALQMLLENCFNHNIVSKNKPLHIKISSNSNFVKVENNHQQKTKTQSTGYGLKNIAGRYRFASNNEIEIIENEKIFAVSLPLIQQQ